MYDRIQWCYREQSEWVPEQRRVTEFWGIERYVQELDQWLEPFRAELRLEWLGSKRRGLWGHSTWGHGL